MHTASCNTRYAALLSPLAYLILYRHLLAQRMHLVLLLVSLLC